MMLTIAIAFIVSVLVTLVMLRLEHLHLHLTADHDLDSVQKNHVHPVPRIGGVGVYSGLIVAMFINNLIQADTDHFGLSVCLVAMPAFTAGLIEDITKKVRVSHRLMACAVSATLGGLILGAWLSKIEISSVDTLLGYAGFSIAFTAFAVAGVANAFNIIDGFNGLSSMVAILILLGMSYVANQVGDQAILITALSTAAAIAGFWLWNFPFGKIFLGDGGAYMIGFFVAELSVLLVSRNPSVSPWFPVLLALYPIFETLFTIFRRVFIHRTHPGMPDAAHLHQLIYNKIVCRAIGGDCAERTEIKLKRNSLTSPFLWLICTMAVLPAMLFFQDTQLLQLIALLFALVYVIFYLILKRAPSL